MKMSSLLSNRGITVAMGVALLVGAPALSGCDGCGGHYPVRDGGVINGTSTDGSVQINVNVNHCPTASGGASPLMTMIGNTITLTATTFDPDGDLVSVKWTADSGTISDALVPVTTFTCTVGGPVTITLTASDGSCTIKQMLPVYCLGIPDGGPFGGGGTGGMGGNSGAGGAGGGMSSGPKCPAGGPAAGEPASGTDITMCCKDTAANCALGPTPGTDGCTGLTDPTDQTLCEALTYCLIANSNKPATAGSSMLCSVSGDPTNCFCGTAPQNTTCFSVKGAANGVCADAFIAAAKSTDPMVIQNRLQSPLFPVGRAVNLNICRGSLLTTCGIN